MTHMGVHLGKHDVYHLSQRGFRSVLIHLGIGGDMNRVLRLERLKEGPLVNLGVNGDNDGEEGLNHLQLDLGIPFLSALTDSFDNGIN